MKLKKRLQLKATLITLCIGMSILAVGLAEKSRTQRNANEKMVIQALKHTSNFSKTVHEYILFGEERPYQQSLSNVHSLKGQLKGLSFNLPAQRDLMRRINSEVYEVKIILDELHTLGVAAKQIPASEVVNRKIGLLNSRIRLRTEIMENAVWNLLSIIEVRYDSETRKIYAALVVFLLTVLFGVALMVIYFYRDVIPALTAIEKGTNALAEGRLDYKINLNRQDELGSVARSFDDMAEQLKIHRALLDKSQEISHLGSWHLDIRKNILSWSAEEYRLFDQKPGTAQSYDSFLALVHPDDREMVDKVYSDAIKNNTRYECIHRISRKDGEIRHLLEKSEEIVDKQGNTIHSFGFTQDITEKKQAEEALLDAKSQVEMLLKERTAELDKTYKQLLHTEKLAAVGSLAASIAHEVNNPLAGISNVLHGLKRRVRYEARDQKLLDMAVEECKRLKELIKGLQDFNRPSSGIKGYMELNASIDNILIFCQREFSRHSIQVETHYASELPEILVVKDQIRQVILNLLTNAMDACDQGGRITITTKSIHGEVRLIIEDNGPGILPEHMPHIFEPFFTTKPEVKGVGLGLSVSYGIIVSHGATIDVESRPDNGTKFTICFTVNGGNNEQKKNPAG